MNGNNEQTTVENEFDVTLAEVGRIIGLPGISEAKLESKYGLKRKAVMRHGKMTYRIYDRAEVKKIAVLRGKEKKGKVTDPEVDAVKELVVWFSQLIEELSLDEQLAHTLRHDEHDIIINLVKSNGSAIDGMLRTLQRIERQLTMLICEWRGGRSDSTPAPGQPVEVICSSAPPNITQQSQ